jgi:dTDP-4-dehydrorhamnose reductase
MRIFIFGANGMLGTYFSKYFNEKYEVIPLTRSQCDIAHLNDNYLFNLLVNKFKFKNDDIILNAAGIIKQRDFDLTELISVNSLFPHLLAEFKSIVNCNVIHVTTDCVYSGAKGNYNENDLHDCLDEYGKSKSLGESNKLTVIRTSIIGEELNNKKSLIAWCQSQKNQTVKGYTNHFWNGVTCLELCHYIDDLIKQNNFWTGIRHVFSEPMMNKYEMVKLFSKVYSLNLTVQPVEVNMCDRSLSSIYNLPVTKTIPEQVLEQANFIIT